LFLGTLEIQHYRFACWVSNAVPSAAAVFF